MNFLNFSYLKKTKKMWVSYFLIIRTPISETGPFFGLDPITKIPKITFSKKSRSIYENTKKQEYKSFTVILFYFYIHMCKGLKNLFLRFFSFLFDQT
jgi:hypothetical protein